MLSFPSNNNTGSRYSFSTYYVPKVKVNDFTVLIEGKSFFDVASAADAGIHKKILGSGIIL